MGQMFKETRMICLKNEALMFSV